MATFVMIFAADCGPGWISRKVTVANLDQTYPNCLRSFSFHVGGADS
jgi:hypothetical protein